MRKRKLPIGIQTFRTIREDACYYVDKTPYMRRLVESVLEGTHYFLSRPRRFGKSLFLDTLKELFEGNEALFEGLAIHDRWDWSLHHPVVRLDFSGGMYGKPDGLEEDLDDQLAASEAQAGTVARQTSAPARFRRLIEELHRKRKLPIGIQTFREVRDDGAPVSGWWCSSTSTTSRSWMR